MNQHQEGQKLNEKAFTLLEILFVLLIVGFLAAESLRRWDELIEKHGRMAVFAGVAELNSRETMMWAKVMVSEKGWLGDAALFSEFDTDLGKDFKWLKPGPSVQGGRLSFQDRFIVEVGRVQSSKEHPGRWQIHGQ